MVVFNSQSCHMTHPPFFGNASKSGGKLLFKVGQQNFEQYISLNALGLAT